MAEYPEARFLTSANAVSQFVDDTGAEVAVGGRSNAGKSSAINAIVNRRQFARTSKTPGRTQLVNFFELSSGRRLVDLPGYGFARVADSVRRHWDSLLTAYFRERNSLAGLILVVDIRRGVSDHDVRMLEFAESVALPVHILLTKADKLKRAEVEQAVAEANKALSGRASVQAFSALKRHGDVEARLVLERLLDGRTAAGAS
jgi:GTP-binding protein